MTGSSANKWDDKRTDETRKIEQILTDAGFQRVDSYRYNSASIRVRVIDDRFAGKSIDERDAMIEPHLAELPESTQADIVNLLAISPEELNVNGPVHRIYLRHLDFDDPRPSTL